MGQEQQAHVYLDHDGPIPFAHRGGAGDWPENTMPAFEGAVALGFRYLETDVHATNDGVLIAFHDDRLDRVTDRQGIIGELPYREVSAAKVDGREPIPLLEDLLGSFPDARINIDAKSDAAVPLLIETITRCNAIDRVCVGSFSDRRLGQVRDALGPALCTSMGPREVARLRAGSWLPTRNSGRRRGTGRVPVAQVPVRQGPVTIVDRTFVRTAHHLGIAVHVWTIDEAHEMHRLLDLGVDGIMTDRPAVLKDVMTQRGLWR
ncbi:MAG: glycerophosphodiester phosphodiesterase [Acidimicrobiia bacterium]